MNQPALPVKLRKEPLIDAVFELRFTATAPASNILPGALFAQLDSSSAKISVQKLPLMQLPEAIRRSDPNFRFAPVIRVDWGAFMVLISDHSLAIGCKLPYPGWAEFKPAILQVARELSRVGIIESVDRYSLKYVDLIPASTLDEQVQLLDWRVRVGQHKLEAEVAALRVEIPEGEFLHIVAIQTGAVTEIPGRPRREGVIVDVDTICHLNALTLSAFLAKLETNLDSIHRRNKEVFFECLTSETVQALDPVYE